MEIRSTVNSRMMREEELAIITHKNISMNNLPDNCLFHIFLFLDVEDRLRSTGVCRRWRNFKFNSWRDVKQIDLITLETSKTQHLRLLKLCGKYLTDLTIPVAKDSNIIRVVTTNCHNLIKFRIQFEYNQDYHCKAEHCKDLAKLFTKNKRKLRNIVIDNMGEGFAHHTDCLLKLPEDLVELQLWAFMAHLARDPRKRSTSEIRSISIIPVLERLKNLEILVLNGLRIAHDEVEMIRSLENLRYLNIFGGNSILDIDSISSSRKLEYLSLQSLLSICDSWVYDLVENNPGLKHLKLTRAYLTEVAEGKLYKLSNLETLSLRYCIFDGYFCPSGFSNLKKFSATQFRDSAIIRLLKTALGLEFVELDGSLNSPKVLEEAHDVASHREKNISLHIVVPENLIKQWKKPTRVSPLLSVESSEDYRTRTVNKYNGYDVQLFY